MKMDFFRENENKNKNGGKSVYRSYGTDFSGSTMDDGSDLLSGVGVGGGVLTGGGSGAPFSREHMQRFFSSLFFGPLLGAI